MGIYMPNGGIIAGSSPSGQAPNINNNYHGKSLFTFYTKFPLFRNFQNISKPHMLLYKVLQTLLINLIYFYIH